MYIFGKNAGFDDMLGMMTPPQNGGEDEKAPEEIQVLTMAYVPYQTFSGYYTDYSEALAHGSLFKTLVKPFYGQEGER